MFARTPKGKLLAFSGAQFGRRVYHTTVDVNDLKTWTFNDDSNASSKISRRALAAGSHATTLSAIVLGTTQSLTTMRAKGSPNLEYLYLTDDIDWTVISGHDTIAALPGDMERTSHISVEFQYLCCADGQCVEANAGSPAH